MIEFNIMGIKIQIKFIFVALVTIFLIVDKTGISVIALLACIIHEIGHLIMFMLVGYKPKKLSFEVTGIMLEKPNTSLSYGKEVLVQLAGSCLNFIVFALLYGYTDELSNLGLAAVTHLVVGIFNLLPLKSFDGGKLLELLLIRLFSIRITIIICTAIDFFCIFILLISGIYTFFYKENSFTLILLSSFLMISAIIKMDYPKRKMG